MHSDTENSRFKIRPGVSARRAEEERNSNDAFPQMRIQGGTAARVAEAESRAARGPVRIRLQARPGETLASASLRSADAANAQSYQGKESAQQKPATSVPENKSSRSAIREYSRQPSAAPDRLPNQATNGLEVKEELSFASNEKKSPTTPSSPLKKLRALFWPKLPKTRTRD
jgi:hypothetical protein